MTTEAPINNLFDEFEGDLEFEAMVLLAEKADKLAADISAWRLARNMSQKDLAKKLGTKQSAISKLEDPSYARYNLLTLAKLAVALGLDLSLEFRPKVPSSVFVTTASFPMSEMRMKTSSDDVNKVSFPSKVA
jgi:predicted XRE-type DNA-binding protein